MYFPCCCNRLRSCQAAPSFPRTSGSRQDRTKGSMQGAHTDLRSEAVQPVCRSPTRHVPVKGSLGPRWLSGLNDRFFEQGKK